MQIAISLNICVGRYQEEQMIPRLARAGFDAMDFNFCDLTDRVDWYDERAVDSLLTGWLETARRAGIGWTQAHGPMFRMFSSDSREHRLKELCVPALRACKQLGVKWMVLHPDIFAGAFDKAHRTAVLAANVDFFRSLLPECEKAEVGIAIENIFDSAGRHGNRQCCRFFGAVPDELCELVDAMNHPLIGACWDTGHARLMQHDQKACLTALGSRLKALHIQENDGKNDDHMLPFVNGGEGVRWKDVAEGLAAARYQGPFTYEAHNAFRALPDELLDITLQYAVAAARHLTSQIDSSSNRP